MLCSSFRGACEAIAGPVLKNVLGIGGGSVEEGEGSSARVCFIALPQSPFADFVEMFEQEGGGTRWFSAMLAGIVRGGLEQLQMQGGNSK
jgi:hypothetical protein